MADNCASLNPRPVELPMAILATEKDFRVR